MLEAQEVLGVLEGKVERGAPAEMVEMLQAPPRMGGAEVLRNQVERAEMVETAFLVDRQAPVEMVELMELLVLPTQGGVRRGQPQREVLAVQAA